MRNRARAQGLDRLSTAAIASEIQAARQAKKRWPAATAVLAFTAGLAVGLGIAKHHQHRAIAEVEGLRRLKHALVANLEAGIIISYAEDWDAVEDALDALVAGQGP